MPEKLETKRKRRSGPQYTPEDRCNSLFYKNYIAPAKDDVPVEVSIRNPSSKLGKRFRKRFRVPYGMFEEICRSLVEEGFFMAGCCITGWPKVMLELLVLAGLRVLGSGCTYDLAEELTNVSHVTIFLGASSKVFSSSGMFCSSSAFLFCLRMALLAR